MEIKFKDVSYTYNEETSFSRKALHDINANIEEGKITGLIGPSGSGKTTFIELINALVMPSKGEIEVGKFILKKNTRLSNINKLRSSVGLVFQYPEEQFFQSTVGKEISFGLKYFNYKTTSIDKRISESLQMVGLDDSYLDRNPFTLSSGEKRKVAIASVLVFNPGVVILDEPTVGLDYKGKKRLIALIKKLKDRYAKTIIICSHDVDMLYQLCDNIIALSKGKIILNGDKYEISKHVALLQENHIKVPKIVEFTYKAINDKGIKLGRFIDIKDLIKDIYRHV